MVAIKEISTNQLAAYIHEAFKGDWVLIYRFHRVNGSLQDCVRDTWHQIDKVSREGTTLDYYGIYLDNQPIGFTVLGTNILLSFGINIQHRTAKIVMEWWDLVVDRLDGNFVTWLFKKNVPVLSFVKRNGMQEIEDNGDFVTLIHHKKGTPCPQEV